MSLSLVNNVASLTAQNNLSKTASSLNSSLERLSTGLKINRGADGPAALVISEQQRAQITGLQAATDNTNKAVSVIQTGEGALNEINGLLNKARSLAIDSSNTGVNDSNAQAANAAELSNILSSIDRIASTTQFGSKKLLDGSSGVSGIASVPSSVTVNKATTDTQTGSYAIAVVTAAQKAFISAGTGQTGALAADENLTINGVQIALKAGSSQVQVRDTINQFSDQTGVVADIDAGNATRLLSKQFGSAATISVVSDKAAAATSSGFGTTVTSDAGVDIQGTIGGGATITGVGNTFTQTSGASKGLSVSIGLDVGLVAGGTADYTSYDSSATLGNVNVTDNSLKFQIGANAGQSVSFSFDKVTTTALGAGGSTLYSDLSEISVANGSESLKVIDQAISDVSTLRGRLGAFQTNTLQSNANNLQTAIQNTTSAESVVRDTDFSTEIAKFTKLQTQLQAGATVLGNANQLTTLVATLLRG